MGVDLQKQARISRCGLSSMSGFRWLGFSLLATLSVTVGRYKWFARGEGR